jgi:acetyl/propionyl-CoA carboxylase alpha subunit
LRRTPSGPGIRLDDGVYEGFTVSTEYDPMLGKLIAYGQDRAEAIARLDRALEEHSVTGIKTNGNLLLSILRDPDFASGEIYTRWLDERLPQLLATQKAKEKDTAAEDAAALAALLQFLKAQKSSSPGESVPSSNSRWKRQARTEQIDRSE